MGKFTNSFSSEDFEIIRNVAAKLVMRHGANDLRARIMELADELQPGRPLSDDMVDALVKLCSRPDGQDAGGSLPGSDELVGR